MTKILLAGKTGQLGRELASALAPLGDLVATGREELDLASPDSIRAAVRAAKPDVIVNAAGYTHVDRAELEPERAMELNAVGPGMLAREAKRVGALLVHFSTDYVFDGALRRPYTEEDEPNPVNAYGRSKLAGERAIAAVGCDHLVLRTSWIYSERGENFVLALLAAAREREEIPVVTDQTGSPTWARTLAQATARILLDLEAARAASGLYHLAAAGETSRYEFARAILETAGAVPGARAGGPRLVPVRTDEYPGLLARRPLHLVTSKEKAKRVFGVELPHWREQLRAFLAGYLAC
jgi:dTDP-4-dehydrorhamnose reductase